MLNSKICSTKSLVSVGLLSLLVGLSSTACRSTEAASEAASNLSDTAVVTPVQQDQGNSAPPAAEPKSEVDPADAYVKDDPFPAPVDLSESEIDFGDAYVRNDNNPPPLDISAEAAGEESGSLQEYNSPPVDDSYIAGEEQIEFFATGTPVVNIPVNEVRVSLEQGKPYGEARAMLISNGWEPTVDPTIDTTYDAALRNMHEMGYVEAEACSGTGLGFCSMAFSGKDGVFLSITLTTSSEVPSVWEWSVYTL